MKTLDNENVAASTAAFPVPRKSDWLLRPRPRRKAVAGKIGGDDDEEEDVDVDEKFPGANVGGASRSDDDAVSDDHLDLRHHRRRRRHWPPI